MKKKIFIDGSAGTTGLRIYDRLSRRDDISLITLPENLRKDESARKSAMNESDAVILCLPDDAAKLAVESAQNPDTVIIDTSTVHRTEPGWVYGFPELSRRIRDAVPAAKRIAVPGCHAGGFIVLVYPLIESGILPAGALLTCYSETGYSGGGKKMIAEYESDGRALTYGAPRQYGIGQNHKHLKEMMLISGLEQAPVFCPTVSDFYSGMLVTVPLFRKQINGTAESIREVYAERYNTAVVRYLQKIDDNGFVPASALSGKDYMEVTVAGNDDRILLMARYDNLGKGASGAAVQLLNLVLGVPETTGLAL